MPKFPPFEVFQAAQNPGNKDLRILALDPGETVGWAVIQGGDVAVSGQVRTTEFTLNQIDALEELFDKFTYDVVVFETYRIYSWMTEQHSWSSVHTAQVIGMIKYFALRRELPFKEQSAQIAKQFCTDEKLKAWGFWVKGQKHARDAIRHGVYFSLFGKLKEE